MTSIRETLLLEGGGVVSLVGAGGKTTLLFRLAKELSEAGETVLTTTTTKIMMPTKERSARVVVSPHPEKVVAEAENLLGNSFHITAGKKHLLPENKLVGFEPDAVTKLWDSRLFRWILVEADGAAQRPLKAPAAHEPVIPECSTHVFAIVGLDAVGKPLEEKRVFRSELYSSRTNMPLGSPITERSVASIILDPEGMMKGCPSTARRCVFLNKAEDDHTVEKGKKIATILCEEGRGKLDQIFIGSAKQEPPFAELYAPEAEQRT